MLGAPLCLLPGALADESSKTGSGEQSVWDVVYDRGYGNNDIFNDCAVDSQGNVIVAGTVENNKPVPDGDFAVIKYDAAGKKIWEFIYDHSNNDHFCGGVAIGGQDAIYATGCTDIGGTNMNILTVGLDRDGNILDGWPREFDLAGKDDIAQDIILDSHGEITIAGWSRDATSVVRVCLLKYLPGGVLPAGWPKYYHTGNPGAYVGAFSLDEDSAGNYVIAGVEETSEDKCILYKVSPNGDVYPGWPKTYDSGRPENFDLWTSVEVDNSGNYVCGGLADATWLNNAAGMLAWYTPDGTLINPPGVIFLEHGGLLMIGPWAIPRLTVAQSNCVLFNSATIKPGPQYQDTVYKYRPDGTAVPGWPRVREGTNNSLGTGIAVDPGGQVFSCGYAFVAGGNFDGLIYKVADANPWYLAEGSTGRDSIGNFETWVLVQNPGPQRAVANIAFQTPAGEKTGPQLTLEPGTRHTVNVAQYIDNEWSVSTRVTSDNPVVAERAVYYTPAGGPYRQAATDSIGASTTAKTWYMAQGSTGKDASGGFETWVLVQNPGTTTANAKLYYQTPAGEVTGPEITLAPGTRQTVNVADTVANNWNVATKVTSDNPVVCECATYWNPAGWPVRQAAADSVGASESADLWYLAEGSTGSDSTGGFETWIFLQNPGAATAIARLYYQTPSGEVTGPAFTLAPGTRQTVNVAETVANNWSVSTKVTSDNPIVCERAIYWNPRGGPIRQAATDSIGVGASSKLWYLAEGSTGSDPAGGFETWVLVQNPGTATARAKLYYQTPTGEVAGPDISLAPGTRQTVNVAWTVANNWSVSTKVTSDNPVVCERAMYWNLAGGPYRQAATDSIGADP
jgi:hypothetical protein